MKAYAYIVGSSILLYLVHLWYNHKKVTSKIKNIMANFTDLQTAIGTLTENVTAFSTATTNITTALTTAETNLTGAISATDADTLVTSINHAASQLASITTTLTNAVAPKA